MWRVQEAIQTNPVTIVSYNHNSLVLAEKVFQRMVTNWRHKYKKFNVTISLYENSNILKQRKLDKDEN